MLDLVRRAGQARLVLAPIDRSASTGNAANLTDIFVVEDPDKPRLEIRPSLPEVKLAKRPRQTLLEEVVGIDRIMRQTARISSKVGKYALICRCSTACAVSRSSSKLAGSPGAAVSTISQPAVFSLLLIAFSQAG